MAENKSTQNSFKGFVNAKFSGKENQEQQWEHIKEVFRKWKGSAPRSQQIEATEFGINRQLKASDKSLSELLRDGIEIISNIHIANDKREMERRSDETIILKTLMESLQNESEEAIKKLDIIKSRWVELNPIKDPMTLNEGLEQQKRRVTELMKQKDVVIVELHLALEKSDERYYLDQAKQIADIYCLVERIDSQVEVMKQAFREHLEILQNTIDEEKRNFMGKSSNTWQELYDKRAEEEELKITNDKNRVYSHHDEIKRIILEHKELIRSTRVRLDLDNDTLQIELENVKAEVLLNSEKLAYNYRVLQKRADENVIIRNQQKRRLGKFQELISELKERTRRIKNKYAVEVSRLSTEVRKLNITVSELKTKTNLFAQVNDQKYHKIWSINETEILEQLKQVFYIDKIIYEDQLCLQWSSTPDTFPDKTELPFFKNAIERTKKHIVINEASYEVSRVLSKTDFIAIRSILDKIALQSKWLVDDKLDELLKPYTEAEKVLVKVDNVFAALNITLIEEVYLLKEHFIDYSWCPNCQNEKTKNSNCENHCYVIESSAVLPALRKFVENREKAIGQTQSLDNQIKYSNVTISRLLTESDVVQFWKNLLNSVPLDKYQLWNALDIGLNAYINVLRRREELDTECEVLRKQNDELKHLLQRFIPDI